MKYTDVKNPVWGNIENTIILCEVNFEDIQEEYVPFSAVASGDYEHTSKIYTECLQGKYGEIANYVPPPTPTNEQLASIIRLQRNKLLSDSDWTQLPDIPNSLKQVWATYRQALRDITLQTEFPQTVTWPTAPQG